MLIRLYYTAFFSMNKEVKEVEKKLRYDLKPQVCHFDCDHFTISEAKSEETDSRLDLMSDTYHFET